LVSSFAAQWLHLRNLDSITPDGRLFPDFDDNLRQAMRMETELLFEEVMRKIVVCSNCSSRTMPGSTSDWPNTTASPISMARASGALPLSLAVSAEEYCARGAS